MLRLIYTITIYLTMELIQPLPVEQVIYRGHYTIDYLTLKWEYK